MADLISMLAAAGGAGGEVDPNFNQTVLLLHGDGTNGAQNNTFLDSSTNNFTITRNGNTTQGTFSPFSAPDGRWSNYFDGSGDYLSVTNDNVFDTNSTFTLEVWVYLTATSTQQIFGRGGGGSPSWNTTNGTQFALYYDSGGIVWQWNNAGSATSISGGTVNLNAWNHVAVGYDGTTTRLWLNGTSIGSSATGYTLPTTRNVIRIGSWTGTASEYLSGYASNLRFVKGTDVYGVSNTSITVPTNSLTAITNTAFLTCQSNRFVDNSTNNFAITRNGDVKVTPFSPFAPTAAYSAGTNGGSGYFDGSGDYLQTPSDSAVSAWSTDFCIEGWYYFNSLPGGTNTSLWTNSTSNSDGMTYAYVDSSGAISLSQVGINNTTSAAGVIKTNEWTHIAYVRNSSSVNIYVNGVSVATPTTTNLETSTTKPLTIGGQFQTSGNSNFLGYISNFRVVKGSPVYTSAFTPPTAPLTAIANTSLLCNFTNAGIFDNTGKNNLETVADAQIDTTTKKYGTGSMEFDGTGDYLFSRYSPDLNLGSGDFTIECWVYFTTLPSNNYMLFSSYGNSGAAAQRWVFGYDTRTITSSPGLFFVALNASNVGVVNLVGGGTSGWSTGTWYHVAVTRSGSSWKLFRDGTQNGSTLTDSDAITDPTTGGLYVGTEPDGSSAAFNGFIDDLRITKGVARYTSNFTAPTKAFPDL